MGPPEPPNPNSINNIVLYFTLDTRHLSLLVTKNVDGESLNFVRCSQLRLLFWNATKTVVNHVYHFSVRILQPHKHQQSKSKTVIFVPPSPSVSQSMEYHVLTGKVPGNFPTVIDM